MNTNAQADVCVFCLTTEMNEALLQISNVRVAHTHWRTEVE